MSLTNDNVQAMPVLQDPVSFAGVPINKVLEGDASAAKNAIPALTFKDVAGNLQYAKVNANNEIVVDIDSEEIACLSDSAKVAGNNSVEQDIVLISLLNDLEYKNIGWIVSCFRQAEFRIVWIDDEGGVGETETELATILVGPGDYTDSGELECLNFTAGSVGTQTLKIVGLNKDQASDLRATLTAKEVQ
jgi:hypothetical protein